jgi:cell division protein FtsL
MSQVIIGAFLLFGFVMVVLLFFMIIFTAALLVFSRGDKKQTKESIGEGQGKEASPDQG